MPYTPFTYQDAQAVQAHITGQNEQNKLINYKMQQDAEGQARLQKLRDIYNKQGRMPTPIETGQVDPGLAVQYQNDLSTQQDRMADNQIKQHAALKGVMTQLVATAEKYGFKRDDPSTYGIIEKLRPNFEGIVSNITGKPPNSGEPVDVNAVLMLADSTPGEKAQQGIQSKVLEQQALLPGQLGLERQKNELEIGKQGQLYGMQSERDIGIEKQKSLLKTEEEGRKAQAKAIIELPKTIDQATQAIGILDRLKTHKGLSDIVGVPGITGGLLGGKIVPGTDAADFSAKLKQVQGQAFLQAFDSLKGGGQITEVEGTKATQAIANLEASQSEKQFKDAVTELQGILKQGLKRAAAAAKGEYNQDPYTGSWGDAPAKPMGIPPGAIVQQSPSTGMKRYSTDGGNTWTVAQ